MTDRAALHSAFLADAGWADATVSPIAGDASTRSYRRLTRGDEHAILMDAPPAAESAPCPPDASPQERTALGYNAEARLAGPNLNAFTQLAGVLRDAGIHAPEILAADPGRGLALIEDLGDGLYARVIPQGADERALYKAAIDVLAHLHATPVPRPAGPDYTLLDYDETALIAEAALLIDWYWPYLHGEAASDTARADYLGLWREMLSALSAPHTLTLRDYHAENILWLGGAGDDLTRVGVIDFQDGLFGHSAYDLVSLLEDARRDVSPITVDAALQHYAVQRGHAFDPLGFESDYALLAAQRNAKILGIFARLIRRDGKTRYEQFMPRVRAHFARDIARPQLAPLRDWLLQTMPELVTS